MWLSQVPQHPAVRPGQAPDWNPPIILTPESSSATESVQEELVTLCPRPLRPGPVQRFRDRFSGPSPILTSEFSSGTASVQEEPVIEIPRPPCPAPVQRFRDRFLATPPTLTPESSSASESAQEEPVINSPRRHKPAPVQRSLDRSSGPPPVSFDAIPELYPLASVWDPIPGEAWSGSALGWSPLKRGIGRAFRAFNPFEARLRRLERPVHKPFKSRYLRLFHPELFPDVGKQFVAMTQQQ